MPDIYCRLVDLNIAVARIADALEVLAGKVVLEVSRQYNGSLRERERLRTREPDPEYSVTAADIAAWIREQDDEIAALEAAHPWLKEQ